MDTSSPPVRDGAVPGQRAARATALAATLCAIHCAATPLLAAAVPFLALAESAEWWALVITGLIGGTVVLLGPTRGHWGVLGALALGLAVWAGSLLGFFEPLPEALTSPAGSLIFAAGMLLSARICRVGECEVCEPGPEAHEA